MAYEHVWALIGLAVVVLWVVRSQLEARKRFRVREMQHRERVAALEKGLDPEQIFGHELEAADTERDDPDATHARNLTTGLVLLFGGIAWAVAGRMMPATQELHELAPLGLIPMASGAAVLLSMSLRRG